MFILLTAGVYRTILIQTGLLYTRYHTCRLLTGFIFCTTPPVFIVRLAVADEFGAIGLTFSCEPGVKPKLNNQTIGKTKQLDWQQHNRVMYKHCSPHMFVNSFWKHAKVITHLENCNTIHWKIKLLHYLIIVNHQPAHIKCNTNLFLLNCTANPDKFCIELFVNVISILIWLFFLVKVPFSSIPLPLSADTQT